MTAGVGLLFWGRVQWDVWCGLTGFEEPWKSLAEMPMQVGNSGLELGRGSVDGDENLGVIADTLGVLLTSLEPYLWRAGWDEFQQPKAVAFGWSLLCLHASKCLRINTAGVTFNQWLEGVDEQMASSPWFLKWDNPEEHFYTTSPAGFSSGCP